jgi:putative ABC transport system permease protein
MHRFLPYILKSLWRHRSRTLLTASGSAMALLVFCLVGAIQRGMDQLAHRRANRQSLVTFQENKFCPATSRLPQDYARSILALPGVRDVVPIQVLTNNCRASLDVVVFRGVPAAQLQAARDFTLVAGSWKEFLDRQDAALVGSLVARRRGIEPGDTFSMGGVTVSVAGVYASDEAAEENYIYTHLDFLQRGRGANRVGVVTQFEVLLEPGTDPATVCEQIDATFRTGTVATITRPKGVFQARALNDLTQLLAMARYLGMACVGLVFALVATTTLMSVQDRIKEHAVLRTLGFSGSRVFGLVLAESTLLSLFGGAVGVVIAQIALEMSDLAIGAEGVLLPIRPSAELAALGIAAALVAGLLAGVVPALQAATADIVPALRTVA